MFYICFFFFFFQAEDGIRDLIVTGVQTCALPISIAGVCILSALVPAVWVTPSWHDVLFGILIGVASTAGQWIVVLAFRYADASVLAPFSYSQLVWVSILGFLIFGEVPDVWTVVGAAFIVASGLYTAHRERVRRSQLLALDGEFSPNA